VISGVEGVSGATKVVEVDRRSYVTVSADNGGSDAVGLCEERTLVIVEEEWTR